MFDGVLRRLIDPPMDALGRRVAAAGIGADQVTAAGLVAALAAFAALALFAAPLAALGFVLASRLLDGLDGAVARASAKTDLGGYLDIVFDFVFYAAVPLGFAVMAPGPNALAAAVLLAAFYVNGASFLAFAAIAAKRGMTSERRGPKSLYFTTGLAEGSETIAVFAAMCLVPGWFAPLAYGFAAVCAVTAIARVRLAVTTFRD